ncbi:MAG: hypothetical protein AB1529_03260 [Candidatus Micrarchaeota archaeon]
MDAAIFALGAAVSVSVILAYIAMAIGGAIIRPRIKDAKALEKAVKALALALFVVLGFSIVPVMVGVFVFMLDEAGITGFPADAFIENDMLLVYLFWAVYAIGMVIAFPAMKKDFFGPDGGGEAKPHGPTWPPLDYQIKTAGAIFLARTIGDEPSAAYEVLEIWKKPEGFMFKKGDAAAIDTKFFQLLGYRPEDGQLVVFFIMDKPPYDSPVELLPAADGRVVFAPGDPTVREELSISGLKERVLRAVRR